MRKRSLREISRRRDDEVWALVALRHDDFVIREDLRGWASSCDLIHIGHENHQRPSCSCHPTHCGSISFYSKPLRGKPLPKMDLQHTLGAVGNLTATTLSFLDFGSSLYTTHDEFVSHCTSFASTASLPDAVLHFSQHVPAGSNISLPENHPSCGVSSWLSSSDICRVAMSVATSETSEMSVEAWFPYDYAGRYLTTTNRGESFGATFAALSHVQSSRQGWEVVSYTLQ